MYEIGPLLLSNQLNHDIVYCIYKHLIHLKTITIDLKYDIMTYNLINVITKINHIDEEILYDTILFHIITFCVLSNGIIHIPLDCNNIYIIKELWRTLSPNDRVGFTLFILDHFASIHMNIYITHS